MVPPRDVTRGARGGRPRMGGDRSLKPRVTQPTPLARARQVKAPASQKAKKRVLFVCIGNACRSQMAEAFARAYGSDTLSAYSAGLAPATAVPPLTRKVLADKNISIEGQFPKGLPPRIADRFDVVINLSGAPLPSAVAPTQIVDWKVRDPIGETESVYRAVAARIEALVMRLILELRGN